MTGQWERYVEQAAEAMWESFRPGAWPRGDGALEPIPAWADCAEGERESCRDEVRAALAVVGPLIAEDTRVRMVEAAAEIVKREGSAETIALASLLDLSERSTDGRLRDAIAVVRSALHDELEAVDSAGQSGSDCCGPGGEHLCEMHGETDYDRGPL